METSKETRVRGHKPAYRQIADLLRNQILSGQLTVGAQLPSTEELAAQLGSSYFTIHTALKTLVKQGWLHRLHGSGTYVAEPNKRFVSVGIYYGENIWSDEESAFYRSVHYALQKKVEQIKKTSVIFVDSRPSSKQHSMLRPLAAAIENREIQCLIAPIVNRTDFPTLAGIDLPTAFITPIKTSHRVTFDERGFLRESLRRLAAQGCRSVGILSHEHFEDKNEVAPSIFDLFLEEIRDTGLSTRENWVRSPGEPVRKIGKYGYLEFRKLLALRERPDGVIVFPDTVARGVIIAALEEGLHAPSQMKFVFHRNAHANLLCPFPVTWAICDEATVAGGLLQLVENQFRGESTSEVIIPYEFKETSAITGSY